ncbi:L-cysteine desulfidase [Ranunculus cassubicifolius]
MDSSIEKLSPFISKSQLVEEFSHHDAQVARINNGSFGSCPASILSAQSQWQLRFLQQPDHFYFKHLQPGILQSRKAIQQLVNAQYSEEISIVDNVTTAAAIVLQQISWAFVEGKYQKGDTVVMLQYTYAAVKKSIHAYISRVGGEVIEVEVPFPVNSDEEILTAFHEALVKAKENRKKVRLAVFDHVSSMPSVVLPVKELVKICREEMVDQVFVDGAHGIGSVHVDVNDIGADFYTSNLHKWFFCPPSVAVLYSKKSPTFQDLHHPVVSHEYGHGLGVECSWVGTRDYSAQLVVPSVLDFVNRFEGGLEGIRSRNHDMVVEMGKMLCEAWGTKFGAPAEMCASMVMVGLPSSLEIFDETDASKLRTHLRVKFGVEVHIYVQKKIDRIRRPHDCITSYARISHHVYNNIDDYYRFRDAIIWLVQDGVTCKMIPSTE